MIYSHIHGLRTNGQTDGQTTRSIEMHLRTSKIYTKCVSDTTMFMIYSQNLFCHKDRQTDGVTDGRSDQQPDM